MLSYYSDSGMRVRLSSVSSLPAQRERPETCHMRVRPAWLLLSAFVLSACGSGSHQPVAGPSGSTTRKVVVSVGHSPRATVPRSLVQIDLKRVMLRTNAGNLLATFTTYNRMHPAWKDAPACGQVGVEFQGQHLALFSSSSRVDQVYGDTAVAQDQVRVRFVDSHTVRLRVPLAALGTDFTATEPWVGFANGFVCPPGGQEEDDTSVVTPQT